MVAEPVRPDPMFAIVGRGKNKVHIIDPEGVPHTEWVIPFSWGGATHCGRDIWEHRGGGQVGEFADEDLCVRCFRAWEAKGLDTDLLFEHEVPEGEWV
jgi:hypothetical protein